MQYINREQTHKLLIIIEAQSDMSRTNSPLRYPGGKSCLTLMSAEILRLNGLEYGHYAEPYAGGCGLALSLLYGGHVSDIHINDVDPAIWAFWHAALNQTEALVERVQKTPVNITEWQRQREIYRSRKLFDPIELGFSAFFLNRTNRSGIIKGAGVIGGQRQEGTYKIDCRYNRDDLSRRILRVGKYRDRIHLTLMDAKIFMEKIDKIMPEKSFLFIDPPYFSKGADLYTSFYMPDDHKLIADTIRSLSRPWAVTYDDLAEIRAIYAGNRQFKLEVPYSVREKKIGAELLIASRTLRLPNSVREKKINFRTPRAA